MKVQDPKCAYGQYCTLNPIWHIVFWRKKNDFLDYLDQMYHVELEIKDTTESNIFASHLDLLLVIHLSKNVNISFRMNFEHTKSFYAPGLKGTLFIL